MRVLALNDDNHEVCFTTENGEIYHNTFQFITKCLALPRCSDIEFIVRGFYICDELDDSIAEKYTEEQVQNIFSCVENANDKVYDSNITFKEAFNILWASSNANW